jgi:hypothetical protein
MSSITKLSFTDSKDLTNITEAKYSITYLYVMETILCSASGSHEKVYAVNFVHFRKARCSAQRSNKKTKLTFRG